MYIPHWVVRITIPYHPWDWYFIPTFGEFILGGGVKAFLFLPLFGEDSQFDYYFSTGLKPPTSYMVLINIPVPWIRHGYDTGSHGCARKIQAAVARHLPEHSGGSQKSWAAGSHG